MKTPAETPTEPGYYWMKSKPDWEWEIVELRPLCTEIQGEQKSTGKFTIIFFGLEWDATHIDTFMREYPQAEFSGPIIPPSHCQRCGKELDEYGVCHCDNDE